MTKFDYDLFTVGAGSGGVRASRVAAAHGARVAIAESHKVGGTCVIRGCVPKKMLVYGAHFAEDLVDARHFGWQIADARFDWRSLRDNILRDVDRLNGLYTQTLNSHGVEIHHHHARVTGTHEVTLSNGERKTARHILIATGARPVVPSVPGAEHGITSNDAFHLDAIPARVLIVGGGYIANEFAGIFNEFGSRVTMVNRSDQLLRGYDRSIVARLMDISRSKGIEFRFNASLEAVERSETGTLTVRMTGHDPLEVDCLLFAMGRVPNVSNLGLGDVGVTLSDGGAVLVDKNYRTNIDSIYAIGDVIDRHQLTPVAIREGQAFADALFGGMPSHLDYSHIPSAVFSHPPIASVGMTEEEARAAFDSVTVHTADFRPMKNVVAQRQERALYRMICDADSGRVIGLHMIGPESPEIMQAAAIAVRAGLTKADFDATMAIHPTLAEELVLFK